MTVDKSRLTSSTSRRVFGGGGKECSGVAMARGPPRGCIALASSLGSSYVGEVELSRGSIVRSIVAEAKAR